MERIFRIFLSEQTCCGVTSVPQVCRAVDRQLRQLLCRESSVLAFSCALPCLQNEYYIPKPAVITGGLLNLSLKDHKYHRFMKYLRLSELMDFYEGRFDFAANAKLRFGVYRKENGCDTFTFDKDAGIFVVVRFAHQAAPTLAGQICSILSSAAGSGDAQAEILTPDPLWKEMLAPGAAPVLSLNDLDITDYSVQQLQTLLAQASFDAAGDPDGKRLILRAGAVFPHRENVPDETLCVNIVRSAL